ncbi:uncharacterized protein N7459_000692 [Penicillium hispanicum]|uniref:uncharacterized protein n=1 Tax=Penicillium hispanicum TaxID=1080232 RepID=UPI002540CE89|nr:uncharacterized protein N7459_000692 [Penicillium hispanicum]KAJ5594484.1 hypothetical protein N7459_000692 [Penicillium hispanicum]
MSSKPPGAPGPELNSSRADVSRKGSVKRARELLEAGVRPTPASPPAPASRPPPAKNVINQTQWPLPASGLQPRPLNPHPHPRFLTPRGPPPQRPPRPNAVPSQIPSQSIYSVRSDAGSENGPPYAVRSARSLPHPKPTQHPPRPSTDDGSCASPTSTLDKTPRTSVSTDDLLRQSAVSASSSVPDVPPIALPEPPLHPADPRLRTAGLITSSTRQTRARRSSVSPIPEERADPRQTHGTLASSRVIPSSWGSGPAASEILEAYLDDDSGDDEHPQCTAQEENGTLVRNASVGKRGKPTVRTILKSNPTSEVSAADFPTSTPRVAVPALGASATQTQHSTSTARRASTSTTSNESFVDPEKPRFARQDEYIDNGALEKEFVILPRAAPTMSDKRPGARKPPALDMNAVRNAEARGSLSSLTDLIRRATKLASNLDRGKTASRADFAGVSGDFRELGKRSRNSGSLSDILASFPNPGLATPETRGSWPVFFGRSGLRNVEPLHSDEDGPGAKRRQQKCCGMPRKWFLLLCILIFIVVVLAILLPVLLVAVPHEKASHSSCATTNPCHNGGVSVSGGSECSCVCSNGYTGSQCTIAGDGSCVTSQVDNGTITKEATMGSSLPTLFDRSQQKFGIDLDPVTIMALFSMNNVSCKTENALVSFDVDTTNSSSNSRRSVELSLPEPITEADEHSSSHSLELTAPSPIVAARSLATNGNLDDNTASSSGTSSADTASSKPDPASTIGAKRAVSPTASRGRTVRSTTEVPAEVVEFSQVAVLYMLQKTGSLTSAMESESKIDSYLTKSYSSASHPSLEVGIFDVDFENKSISVNDSTS